MAMVEQAAAPMRGRIGLDRLLTTTFRSERELAALESASLERVRSTGSAQSGARGPRLTTPFHNEREIAALKSDDSLERARSTGSCAHERQLPSRRGAGPADGVAPELADRPRGKGESGDAARAAPATRTVQPPPDTRPVRGVVELWAVDAEALPALASRSRMLLIAGKGTLMAQELGSFETVVSAPLCRLAARPLPGFDNMMLLAGAAGPGEAAHSGQHDWPEAVCVAVPDCLARERWLEALAGMGVKVEGWTAGERTALASRDSPIPHYPDCIRPASIPCYLNGQPAPIRWIS